MTVVPAPRPCVTCPYRRDVPSGVWDADEYAKLPEYDDMQSAPMTTFICHQQDGRLCAGWVVVHDMQESVGLRLLAYREDLSADEWDAILDYTTDVPLFDSGGEAAAHGLKELTQPGTDAVRAIRKLQRRRGDG